MAHYGQFHDLPKGPSDATGVQTTHTPTGHIAPSLAQAG